jgi:hypothetical protein
MPDGVGVDIEAHQAARLVWHCPQHERDGQVF